MSKQIDKASQAAKYYFSKGAMLYSVVLPVAAGIGWEVLARIWPYPFKSEFTGLVICWVTAYFIAYILPEPPGYEAAGKMRWTKDEIVTALVSGPLTFATILGAKCWTAPYLVH